MGYHPPITLPPSEPPIPIAKKKETAVIPRTRDHYQIASRRCRPHGPYFLPQCIHRTLFIELLDAPEFAPASCISQPSGTINVLSFQGFAHSLSAIFGYSYSFQYYPPSLTEGGVPPLFFHPTIFFSIAYLKNKPCKTPFLRHFSSQTCHFCCTLASRNCAPLIPGCSPAAAALASPPLGVILCGSLLCFHFSFGSEVWCGQCFGITRRVEFDGAAGRLPALCAGE